MRGGSGRWRCPWRRRGGNSAPPWLSFFGTPSPLKSRMAYSTSPTEEPFCAARSNRRPPPWDSARDAAALEVEDAERMLRVRQFRVGGNFAAARWCGGHPRRRLLVSRRSAEVVARDRVSLGGRLLQPGAALGRVLRHAATVERHQAERGERMWRRRAAPPGDTIRRPFRGSRARRGPGCTTRPAGSWRRHRSCSSPAAASLRGRLRCSGRAGRPRRQDRTPHAPFRRRARRRTPRPRAADARINPASRSPIRAIAAATALAGPSGCDQTASPSAMNSARVATSSGMASRLGA